MPESVALLLERTGQQLLSDYIVARTSINLSEDAETMLKGHASLGQTMVGLVNIARLEGLIVPDDDFSL